MIEERHSPKKTVGRVFTHLVHGNSDWSVLSSNLWRTDVGDGRSTRLECFVSNPQKRLPHRCSNAVHLLIILNPSRVTEKSM